MTGPNLPPNQAEDGSRLIARMQNKERARVAPGPRTIAGQDDVDADRPANNDLLTYDSTLRKWVNRAPGSAAGSDALYGQPSLVVAAGDADDVSWALGNGPALLDLSTPTLPTAVDSGVFIFTVEMNTASILSVWSLFVVVREGGPTNRIARMDPLVAPGTTTATLAVFMDAGDPIRVQVGNADGSSSGTFSANITVCRIGSS